MKKHITSEQICEKIRKKGYKISKARLELIKTLLKSDTYLTVDKLALKMKASNISSLYNNIWLLDRLKIIDTIYYGSKKMFQIPYDPDFFSLDYTGYYVTKNNKIKTFPIDEELKLIKNKLSDLKIKKIKIIVSEK